MKTALELLGKDRKRLAGVLCAEGEERDTCAICKKTVKSLELVAQRAREEMREAALDAVSNICDPCRECGSEGDRCQGLVIAEMEIRKLPVAP